MSTKPVYVIGSKHLGDGSEDLGDILARGMFRTLTKIDPLPETIIFLNSGVELLVKPEIQENLTILEEKGVQILACGTCVDFYEIREQLNSDHLSNMADILTTINNATKVVNF